MPNIVEKVLGTLMITALCVGFLYMCSESVENDEKRREKISTLAGREYVGEIATGPNTTIRLFEFEHPTRPGMTCLWAAHPAHQGGLHCWRD